MDIRKDTRPSEPDSFTCGHVDIDSEALEPALAQLCGHGGDKQQTFRSMETDSICNYSSEFPLRRLLSLPLRRGPSVRLHECNGLGVGSAQVIAFSLWHLNFPSRVCNSCNSTYFIVNPGVNRQMARTLQTVGYPPTENFKCSMSQQRTPLKV